MSGRILFTGGGSAGHVTPNIALMEQLASEGWDIRYVGSRDGIEKEIVSRLDIPYLEIPTGKLRRYFSWRNFLDPFLVLAGVFKSLFICLRERPDAVFSKGGFVAVPLVFAAWLCRVPVISHESDVTPGLANRLCFPFCRKICVNFPQTGAYLPGDKVVLAGTPIRDALIRGDAGAGRRALSLDRDKPVLLVFGGSLGARAVNDCLRAVLPTLLARFQVVHVTGSGNIDSGLEDLAGYHQREYIHDEFGDVLAAADLVISRAGANAIYELLALRKPHILIPLPSASSRGDQIVNARTFAEAGMSVVIPQEELDADRLLATVDEAWARRETLIERMAGFEIRDSVGVITNLIKQYATH